MTGDDSAQRHPPRDEELRARLAEELTANGDLRSDAWRTAFRRVPRHMFVPSFFRPEGPWGRLEHIDGGDLDEHDAWLNSVYSDDTLYTQVNDAGSVLSSSTSPGLMALMLEALDIADGMQILEIGTGTGYNAALLCERLGSARVTSIDIDRELIATARERLASADYFPHLDACDGLEGYQANAPYDRILSTVAVPAIPVPWIRQVRRGGRILANLYRELGAGALALLTARGDFAEGRFLAEYGGFMPIRAIQHPPVTSLLHAAEGECDERETQISGGVLDDPSFAFFAAFFVPAQRLGYAPHGQPEEFWLLSGDGSWARQTRGPEGGLVACQHGPRRLWDALERSHSVWVSLASPPRREFGLTVTTDGRHALWCSRDVAARWTLEPGRA